MDEQKPAAMTDESIDQIVQMVESAEVLGQSLGMTVPQAMRVLLKSCQAMTQLKAKVSDAIDALPRAGVH